MEIITLCVLFCLLVLVLRLFVLVTAHKLSEDDFWLDEPSGFTAGDQAVVDIALSLYELDQQEGRELDHEKSMLLRKEMKKECGHLVKTIMSINLLDPEQAQADSNVIDMSHFIKR